MWSHSCRRISRFSCSYKRAAGKGSIREMSLKMFLISASSSPVHRVKSHRLSFISVSDPDFKLLFLLFGNVYCVLRTVILRWSLCILADEVDCLVNASATALFQVLRVSWKLTELEKEGISLDIWSCFDGSFDGILIVKCMYIYTIICANVYEEFLMKGIHVHSLNSGICIRFLGSSFSIVKLNHTVFESVCEHTFVCIVFTKKVDSNNKKLRGY